MKKHPVRNSHAALPLSAGGREDADVDTARAWGCDISFPDVSSWDISIGRSEFPGSRVSNCIGVWAVEGRNAEDSIFSPYTRKLGPGIICSLKCTLHLFETIDGKEIEGWKVLLTACLPIRFRHRYYQKRWRDATVWIIGQHTYLLDIVFQDKFGFEEISRRG